MKGVCCSGWMRAALIGVVIAGSWGINAVSGEDGTVEVKLGANVERSWEQVKKDGYAYGPKQEHNGSTGETHVYLPYGNNRKLYHEVAGSLSDPGKGCALFTTVDGQTNARLTYKLSFDKPIASFKLFVGWAELGLNKDTVAGFEYSIDGKEWKPVLEIKGSEKSGAAIVEPMVKNVEVKGLDTKMLYIRGYSRNPSSPDGHGPGKWLKFRMTGDPNWGDASTTFFKAQPQIWVTEKK